MARIQSHLSQSCTHRLGRRNYLRGHTQALHKRASRPLKPATALPNPINEAIHIPKGLASFFLRNLNRFRHISLPIMGFGAIGIAGSLAFASLAMYWGGIQTYVGELYHSTALLNIYATLFLLGSAIRRVGFPGKYFQKIWLPRVHNAKRKLALLLPQLEARGKVSKPLHDQIVSSLSISEVNQIAEYFPHTPTSLEFYGLNTVGLLQIAQLHLRLLKRVEELQSSQPEKARRVLRGVLAAHHRNGQSCYLTSIEQFEKIRRAYGLGLSNLNGGSVCPLEKESMHSRLWQKASIFIQRHRKAFFIGGTTLLTAGLAIYFDHVRYRMIHDIATQCLPPGVMDKLRFTLLFAPIMAALGGLSLLQLPSAFGLTRRRFLKRQDDITTPPRLSSRATHKFKRVLRSIAPLEEPLRKFGVTILLPSLATAGIMFVLNRLFIPQIMSEMTIRHFTPTLLFWITTIMTSLGGLGMMMVGTNLRHLNESSWIKRGDFEEDFKPRILEANHQLQTHLDWLRPKIEEERNLLDSLQNATVSEVRIDNLFFNGERKGINQIGKILFAALDSAEARQLQLLGDTEGGQT